MTEMNDQLSLEYYSPFEVEKKWQEKWESQKAFSPTLRMMESLFVLSFRHQM